MFTDDFTHEVNSFLQEQGDMMLRKQAAVNQAVYYQRTGSLTRSLSGNVSVGVDGPISVTVEYPKHIRFLDMKKGRNGKLKKRYAPIYNRYVFGYLKSALWKKLTRVIPSAMVRTIDSTIQSV